ncbi:MAG: CCA tRNA nucleotidyltransferase [Pseudomonadota bacterium]
MAETIGAPAWATSKTARSVLAALSAVRAGSARFVGGCVRNAVMGRPVDDVDIATQLEPLAVIDALETAGLRAIPTGVEHGTVTAVVDNTPYEITTLRRDVETDGRRAVVAFTEDWAEDARRRDFRLNALYAEPDGTLHDPTGGGLDDARAGRVVFIGDADARLREDYLRILRFFRFNAWYGADMDAEGLAACARQKAGLEKIAAERIWKELRKLLDAPDPSAAVEAMAKSGVLSAVLPTTSGAERLSRLVALETTQIFSHDPMHRLMALIPRDGEAAKATARALRLSNAEADRLTDWAADETRFVSWMSARDMRRAAYRLGKTRFADRAMLEWASGGEGSDVQWRALLALGESWTPPVFPLGGADVAKAGVAPGPLTGRVLREVEDWWVDADFTDDRLSLIERLKAVVQGLAG